jgi:hypothetical protein
MWYKSSVAGFRQICIAPNKRRIGITDQSDGILGVAEPQEASS